MRIVRLLAIAALAALPSVVFAADALMMGTTVGARDSGLLEHLRPLLFSEMGIDLKWKSIGAGKVLEHAKNCDVDVLLVHDPDSGLKMVEEGFAVDRREVMYTVEDGSGLPNQYSVMTVNPAGCPRVKAGLAGKFSDWLVCASTQNHIAAFRLAGKQRFFPNAPPPSR